MRKTTSVLFYRLFILLLLILFCQSVVFGQTPVEQAILETLNHKKDVVYKTVDGVELNMDIFYPAPDKIQDKNPWMLHVHGGGWAGVLTNYTILKMIRAKRTTFILNNPKS